MPISKKTLHKKRQFNILKTKKTSVSRFGGYPEDLFFGLLYLKQKYKKILGLPFDIRKLIEVYQSEIALGKSVSFAGCIIYRCKKSIVDNDLYISSDIDSSVATTDDLDLSKRNTSPNKATNKYKEGKKIYRFNKSDFELVYPGLVDEDAFFDIIKTRKAEGKSYVIIPLIFKWTCSKNQTGHANSILIDLKKMQSERFEPYGKTRKFSKNEQAVANHFDKIMKTVFAKIGIKYFKPGKFVPRKGPQYIEEKKLSKQNSNVSSNKETDPEGYCGAWSLWYADLRMSNSKLSRKRVLKRSIRILKNQDNSLRAFIRNYSRFILKQRKYFLKKIGDKHTYRNLQDHLQRFNSQKTELEELLKTEKI